MKILMLVNWKVKRVQKKPKGLQPPDYIIPKETYWFFKHFKDVPTVDVIDISSNQVIEKIEKKLFRFYILQTVKALRKINQYDLVISHGMQSGAVLALWRRLFKTKAKHIVVDIGNFAAGKEHGIKLKLMQIASKSLDGVIYHTSNQINYYKKCFPWIVNKSRFIRFGADLDLFKYDDLNANNTEKSDEYFVCVGYDKRDWATLVKAYASIKTDCKLRIIGHVEKKYNHIKGVQQVPFVPIDELIKQIKNSKFSVLPLQLYNYSYGQMTLLQQMAMKKCVIAARVPSLIDYAVDNQSVIFYTPGDVRDLKEKLQYVLNNENVIKQTGENAYEYLHKRCNEQTMANGFENYVKCVVLKNHNNFRSNK